MATDKTIVISGHGAIGARTDLVLFRDVLVEIREKVAALKGQGRSLPEVIAAKPGARYDAERGNLFTTPSAILALVVLMFLGKTIAVKEKSYAHNHYERWYADLLQGLGTRPAHSVQSRLAAVCR
jgi:hypothetical protein